MSAATVFGIVGGYGATGRAVASELLRSTEDGILVGGRDAGRAAHLAAELGARASAARLDVLDERSLDAFCLRCSIVVHCAGPVFQLGDRVAQAARRAGRHYVDLAGLAIVKERMLPHDRELADRGLSCLVSAGWTPGLTELLPIYAHARAREEMDTLETLDLYFSDSGDWSTNALRDGVRLLRRRGLPRPGSFRRGTWRAAEMGRASRRVDLGEPVGRRWFSSFTMPELDEVGRRLSDCDFAAYSYLSGARNALAAIAIALLPLPESLGVRLLRGVFRRNRLPVGGFVVARLPGRAGGSPVMRDFRITFPEGRGYWINGLVAATAARMIARGGAVRPGVRYLSEAVEPREFMTELRAAGVELVESAAPVPPSRLFSA